MSNKPDNDQNKNVAKKSKSHLVTNIQFAGKVVRIFWEDAFGDIKESFARPAPVKSSGGSVGCSLIHRSPIHKSKNDHNDAYFVLSADEAKKPLPHSNPIRCVQKKEDENDDKATLDRLRIVIDDSYNSTDAAAMAAANKIITEMKILNCEYSISIYQCPECKQYFLGGIRKGFKDTVKFDNHIYQYGVGNAKYIFTLAAVVHSHPIIREKDWCPDEGEHVAKPYPIIREKDWCPDEGEHMAKQYPHAEREKGWSPLVSETETELCSDAEKGEYWSYETNEHTTEPCPKAELYINRYRCTVNKGYIGGNHDFSTADYTKLHDLKTSTIGYLVAKKTSVKESDGWTLVKFEWPTGNNFNNGVRVWKPASSQWDNVQ